jgi:hypothetical protein
MPTMVWYGFNIQANGGIAMKTYRVLTAATLAAGLVAAMPAWADGDGIEKFTTTLSGFNEVGVLNAESGAILSGGVAKATVELDKANQTATYTLTITSAPSSPILQAHIHFGKEHVAGGVMLFFCANGDVPLTPPANTPSCPTSTGTITGTWTASSVQAIPTQNVTDGDFLALVEALESGTAYANIHTADFPTGELRGQMGQMQHSPGSSE